MASQQPATVATGKDKPGCASVNGSASTSKWKETQDLLASAILAVNELSKHLKEAEDLPRMYKANKALHELWEIQ